MKLQCVDHGLELKNGRCPACYDQSIAEYTERFKGMTVTLSVPSVRSPYVIADGIKRLFYHETEYLELAAPAEIYDDLMKLIDNVVAKYQTACQCVQCETARRAEAEEQ